MPRVHKSAGFAHKRPQNSQKVLRLLRRRMGTYAAFCETCETACIGYASDTQREGVNGRMAKTHSIHERRERANAGTLGGLKRALLHTPEEGALETAKCAGIRP